MKYEMKFKATAMVQRHLDRNPRVNGYAEGEGDVFVVKFESNIPISRGLSAEAVALGLDPLSDEPYNG